MASELGERLKLDDSVSPDEDKFLNENIEDPQIRYSALCLLMHIRSHHLTLKESLTQYKQEAAKAPDRKTDQKVIPAAKFLRLHAVELKVPLTKPKIKPQSS